MLTKLLSSSVLSLDIATKNTGVYFRDDAKSYHKTLHAYGHHAWFREFADIMYGVDIAFIEGYAFNGSRVTQIAEIVGILRAVAGQFDAPVITIPIQTWKSVNHVIGVPKDGSYIDVINRAYSTECETADEVDAYLIYRTALVSDECRPDIAKQICEAMAW